MSFFNVTLTQSFHGRIFQNVFHLEDSTGLITQELIAQRIISDWIPHFVPVQTSDLVYTQVAVRRILVEFPLATTLVEVNIPGAITGGRAVGFESYLIRFFTGLAGRKFRGRYFIGGLAQGFISQLSEGMNGAALVFAGSLILTLSDKWAEPNPNTFLNLVIAHKDDSTPTRVSSIGFEQNVTALRSRKIGVGI